MATSLALLATSILAGRGTDSANTTLEHQHPAHLYQGEDYIVRGLNLKKLENKLGGFRNFLKGRRKPLQSYPWVATLLLAQKQLVYEHMMKGKSGPVGFSSNTQVTQPAGRPRPTSRT